MNINGITFDDLDGAEVTIDFQDIKQFQKPDTIVLWNGRRYVVSIKTFVRLFTIYAYYMEDNNASIN